MKLDPDLKLKTPAALRQDFMQLRRQLRKIRDARDDRMCWTELVRIYLMLPEKKIPSWLRISKNPVLLNANCRRFWRRECGMREIQKLLLLRRKR